MAFGEPAKTKDPAIPTALTAFIDQGSEFSGKLNFKDTVRIDGKFEGEITSENTLIVGETGRVSAHIKSGDVIVSGEVKGDIQASGRVTLHRSARVEGNIQSAKLVVEDGAQMDGQIHMTGAAKPGGQPAGKSGDVNVVKMRETGS